MALNALLKFTQGVTVGPDGEALVVTAGTPVTVENSTGATDLGSWRLFLCYAPPGSVLFTLSPVVVAQSTTATAPTWVFTPDAGIYGCYRFHLVVYSASSFAGDTDEDVRNAAVVTPLQKYLVFAPQLNPEPLPATGPGAKPNEFNFGGHLFGWAGDGDPIARGLNDALLYLDSLVGDTDQYVAISATDSTPGFLSSKLSLGLGLRSDTLNPAGNEQLELNLPDMSEATGNYALVLEAVATMEPRYITTDGTHLWYDNGYSFYTPNQPNGYVRFLPNGAFLESADFVDTWQTWQVLYESTEDQMVLLRQNISGGETYLVPLSRDVPAVAGTPVEIDNNLIFSHLVAGEGYIWAHGSNGLVKKIDASNFATQTSLGGGAGESTSNSDIAYDSGPSNRYGDSQGRVFFSLSPTDQDIGRYRPDTDAQDATHRPSATNYPTRCLSVDEIGGRLWCCWSEAGATHVGSFDCETFGANQRSLDIDSIVPNYYDMQSVLYYDGYCYVLAWAGSQVQLLKVHDTGAAIVLDDSYVAIDLDISANAPGWRHMLVYDGYLYFPATPGSGVWNLYRTPITDLSQVEVATPWGPEWSDGNFARLIGDLGGSVDAPEVVGIRGSIVYSPQPNMAGSLLQIQSDTTMDWRFYPYTLSSTNTGTTPDTRFGGPYTAYVGRRTAGNPVEVQFGESNWDGTGDVKLIEFSDQFGTAGESGSAMTLNPTENISGFLAATTVSSMKLNSAFERVLLRWNNDNGWWQLVARYRRWECVVITGAASPYAVVSGYILAECATDGGAITVTLPASPQEDDQILVVDSGNNAETNNITVNGNGKDIAGASTYVISQDSGSVHLRYDTTSDEWQLLATALDSGAGASVDSELWSLPASPNAADDEFDGALGAEWDVYSVTAGTNITPSGTEVTSYSAPTTINVEDAQTGRRSWLLLQANNSGDAFYVSKSYTVPANVLILARLKSTIHLSMANNQSSIGLVLLETATGEADGTNRTVFYLTEVDGATAVQANVLVYDGANVEFQAATETTSTAGSPLEYVAIHKVGTDLYFWAGTASGSWVYLGTYDLTTHPSTPSYDRVGFAVLNVANSIDGGTPIVGVDFIRVIETDKFKL